MKKYLCSLLPLAIAMFTYWLTGGEFERGPVLAFCFYLGAAGTCIVVAYIGSKNSK